MYQLRWERSIRDTWEFQSIASSRGFSSGEILKGLIRKLHYEKPSWIEVSLSWKTEHLKDSELITSLLWEHVIGIKLS